MASREYLEISAPDLEDKIQGGLLGQILGNLNGLEHENKYIDEPGTVVDYTPGLPDGAHSDDDTDIEWVYAIEMQRSGDMYIPPERISELWRMHINTKIWCANLYTRRLMDLNIDPPLTGRIALNPWSIFNISGQFICESFGLIAPAMPQTAAKIGLHYTHVTIDGEPAQTTQLFTAMIATAFTDSSLTGILRAGLSAIDKESEIYRIVTHVYSLWKTNPAHWMKTRELIKEGYSRHNGETRDRNGYELNAAATIAALLYGQRDLAQTLQYAFNFGWDADNNAATAGAIIGVIQGRKWMDSQGWNIKDIYRNITREGMPEDETIKRFGSRLLDLARKIVIENGGREIMRDGIKIYLIPSEKPKNMEPLPEPLDRKNEFIESVAPGLEKGLTGSQQLRARTAYLAIALGEAERLRRIQPIAWQQAVESLKNYPELIDAIYNSPNPSGDTMRERVKAEGLKPQK